MLCAFIPSDKKGWICSVNIYIHYIEESIKIGIVISLISLYNKILLQIPYDEDEIPKVISFSNAFLVQQTFGNILVFLHFVHFACAATFSSN